MKKQSGATLMEFVIVFPIAILFVLGLIQTGFIYMAKLNLNHATFMAARVGTVHNANPETIRTAFVRGLSPFYQNSFDTNPHTRLAEAAIQASLYDKSPLPHHHVDLKVLNPSNASFADFGVKDPTSGKTYIPNDNLEWRTQSLGPSSQQTLRDANLLKLWAVYPYELKVPLMAGILRRTMCGGSFPVKDWGEASALSGVYKPWEEKCIKYYLHGRIPIESSAIVEMQTRAER
jgi:hypothetical protein